MSHTVITPDVLQHTKAKTDKNLKSGGGFATKSAQQSSAQQDTDLADADNAVGIRWRDGVG